MTSGFEWGIDMNFIYDTSKTYENIFSNILKNLLYQGCKIQCEWTLDKR